MLQTIAFGNTLVEKSELWAKWLASPSLYWSSSILLMSTFGQLLVAIG
jgi:hypothetical protein